MRTPHALVVLSQLLLVLLAGCAGGQKAPVVDTAVVSAAVDSAEAAFGAAVAAKDTNAVVALYAPDAYVLPPSAPRCDGAEAIHKLFAGMLAMPGLQLTLEPGQKIISQAGDLVVDIGTYDFQATGPGKKPMHDVGKYLTVFKKGDAGWKIVADAWNSDLALAGQAK